MIPHNLNNLAPTIIIIAEVHGHLRGYSLIGREFYLKEREPRFDEAEHLDGVKLKDMYYVVDRSEYLRVVPEASKADFKTPEVYIPVYVAKRSFRAKYIGR
jgi:hypothetical protein